MARKKQTKLPKGITQLKSNYRVTYRDETSKVCTKYFPCTDHGLEEAKKFKKEVDYKKAHNIALPRQTEEERPQTITVNQVAQDWVNLRKLEGKDKEWLRHWASTYNQAVLPFIGQKDIRVVRQQHITEIVSKNWSDKSVATKNRYVAYIKSIFALAIENEYLERNPLRKWKPLKEQRRVSTLQVKDFRKLQKHAPQHLAWALEVNFNIPVRPGNDLFSLKFDDVDFNRKKIKVYHSKVRRETWISLTDTFIAILKEKQNLHKSGYIIEYKGRPVKKINKSLTNTAKLAGVNVSCLYDLRHLFITYMLNKGVSLATIADVTGTSAEMIWANYYEHIKSQREFVNAVNDFDDDTHADQSYLSQEKTN